MGSHRKLVIEIIFSVSFYWLVAPLPTTHTRCMYPSSNFTDLYVCVCAYVCRWSPRRADEAFLLSIVNISSLFGQQSTSTTLHRVCVCVCVIYIFFNIQGGVAMDRISALPPSHLRVSLCFIRRQYLWCQVQSAIYFDYNDFKWKLWRMCR